MKVCASTTYTAPHYIHMHKQKNTYTYTHTHLTVACCFAPLAACSLPTGTSHTDICHLPLRVSAHDPRCARAMSFLFELVLCRLAPAALGACGACRLWRLPPVALAACDAGCLRHTVPFLAPFSFKLASTGLQRPKSAQITVSGLSLERYIIVIDHL